MPMPQVKCQLLSEADDHDLKWPPFRGLLVEMETRWV